MRQPASRLLVLFLALFVGLATGHSAFADPRSDAKVHYQAGMKAYQAADYRTAIGEFQAAQQIAPADLMNYNIALCYDKLGEAEPAIQYYRAYLDKVPNATNRTEIEASVSRLEGALKSAAQKRADEQKAADDARKAEEARKAGEARKAEEARKAAEAHKVPDNTGKPTDVGKPADKPADKPAEQVTPPPTGVGSTGTPGSAQTVSTGDAQLDRAAAIDINQIRAQRMGTGAAAMAPTGAAGPAGTAGAGAAGVGAGAQANAGPRGTNPGSPAEPPPTDQPKKATPVYKKWWFWVVVAISAVVVYQIATEGSNAPKSQAREVLPPTSPRAASDTGFTLLRF